MVSPENGGSVFLQNLGIYVQDHVVLQPRRTITTYRHNNLKSHFPNVLRFVFISGQAVFKINFMLVESSNFERIKT